MFTHLSWIWWAADPVELMLHTRREMQRLRNIHLPERVWDSIELQVLSWTDAQLVRRRTDDVKVLADALGKGVHTHILYHIVLEELRARGLMHCQRLKHYK